MISRADRASLEELMSKIEGETEPYIFTDVGPTELKGLAAWLPEPGSTPPPEYLALGQLLRELDPITDKLIAGTITKRVAAALGLMEPPRPALTLDVTAANISVLTQAIIDAGGTRVEIGIDTDMRFMSRVGGRPWEPIVAAGSVDKAIAAELRRLADEWDGEPEDWPTPDISPSGIAALLRDRADELDPP